MKMYKDNPKFTRLTLEQGDKKMVWEMPYEDVGADELLHAFNSLLIGFTWNQNTIFNTMAGYLQEHASELYDIYEHQDDEAIKVHQAYYGEECDEEEDDEG